jgi:outer membrane receptor protein involved in Fe transport
VGIDATFGRTSLAGNVVAVSSQYFRGDEANLLDPIDGYALVNLAARHQLRAGIAVAANVTNLFGAEYSTFGLLGEADDVLGDDFEDPRFVSPGAPFGIWVGIEMSIP